PTTPAQYFHLLRRQVRDGFERPLIVMTPKSLLRLPAASSSLDQLTNGGFQPLIDDSEIAGPNAVERIVFCSGKVFYDLADARKKRASEPGADPSPSGRGQGEGGEAIATGSASNVAIIRVEQLYPFPLTAVKDTLAKYSNAKNLVWCQEEPRNMGGWTFMEAKFEDMVPGGEALRYAGRAESPSPATGSYAVHTRE